MKSIHLSSVTKRLLIVAAVIAIIGAGWLWVQRGDRNDNTLRLYGNVDIREVQLAFRQSGRVAQMHFDEGDHVEAGARLASLDAQPFEEALAAADASVDVSQAELDAALALLSSKQHADGGWSIRDMSLVNDWHFEMSPTVLGLIQNLPDVDRPESDPYMTALAVVLMRQNDVPVSDPRIQQGLTWLKREQRASGRWWMHSLYRGNFHYITYIATIEAIKALDLCGELDAIAADEN